MKKLLVVPETERSSTLFGLGALQFTSLARRQRAKRNGRKVSVVSFQCVFNSLHACAYTMEIGVELKLYGRVLESRSRMGWLG